MAAIVYLDVDDEITSAAARIRSGSEDRVALVVPSGSRLATSRINFRLLAREAQTRDRRLSIVAADSATRALAASAGLPVFGSVAEFEDAVESAPAAPAMTAPAAPVPLAATDGSPAKSTRRARPKVAAAETAPLFAPPPLVSEASDGEPADLEATQVVTVPVMPPVASRASTIRVAGPRRLAAFDRPNALVASGVLGLAVVVVAIGAWLLLPSASIVVTAREEPLAPLNLTVRADPTADAPDIDARVVPAERLTFELTATDTFTATDQRVEQTAASGSVTFRSYNTGSSNTIPRGSVVSTEGGIQFLTRQAVTLARARFVLPATVLPTSASVPVDALRQGPGGNVPANAITVVPPGENPEVTTVTNPEPMSGGTRTEFPRVAQADVDAAIDQLTLQLGTDFETILADPSRTPEGLTLFPATRSIAEPVPSVDPATLVGQEVATFELNLTSSGSVIAVDTAPVATIAETRIRAGIAADHHLVDSSLDIRIGDPIVEGESVSFPVTARAAQIRVLDENVLREEVKGRSVDDARTILGEFGDVNLTVWPDWVTTIPTIDARLELRVVPTAGSGPGPPSGSIAP